ncbi:pyridoxine 5'-phosphate synthase [Aliifodinibius sp. S!AR15-10]|uniref:pyridoxine 5'-phosphate synthase n=1 Tax=Aliifodinibius sp. S!AR15-10 TaxID=2950437 RepID=UPI002866442D|nr:pyridoxine 5'-phosphate synthase [Aliifodinibius sp. S!AR15-10]MDR8393861.1 pyridoxine 5'-phosphate synthase [Aliifodinibius sp. S!AR15-10]
MRLLVNVDHVATLRNARGEGYPDPVEAARVCEEAGAAGIVFHLRKDRRHIREADVYRLKENVKGILDFEMAATKEMIETSIDVNPHLITLVPESREELTTEGGLSMDTVFEDFKSRVFPKIRETDIEISLFVDPNPGDIEKAAELGSDAVELHTGTYANARTEEAQKHELHRLKEAAEQAHKLGMKVNAGHGLNLNNTEALVQTVPHLHDISIGHALVSSAVFMGLENTVKAFLEIMEKYN